MIRLEAHGGGIFAVVAAAWVSNASSVACGSKVGIWRGGDTGVCVGIRGSVKGAFDSGTDTETNRDAIQLFASRNRKWRKCIGLQR